MTHYVAIVEQEEGKAVGVWFLDLPGCVSAGDTHDEAMLNAAGALELWAGAMIESGQNFAAAKPDRSQDRFRRRPRRGPLHGGAHPVAEAFRGRIKSPALILSGRKPEVPLRAKRFAKRTQWKRATGESAPSARLEGCAARP
ncbi:MAG: type II toxin-antitoxin system HicB family antitoxin [Methylocella sp.]